MEKDFILAAYIGKAHGIKGEVMLKPALDDITLLKEVEVFLEGGKSFPIQHFRMAAKGALVTFEAAQDRTDAEKLQGTALYIKRADLPAVAEGETYYVDLKGLDVQTVEGVVLGRVVDVFYNNAQDVLVIWPQDGAEEVLIPYVEDTILEVNAEQNTLHVTPFGESFFSL